mmetsp:Transcript_48272/g.145927  ORF Transcript_48272/g.145927 Transcript_48272/m.145927 type:complete len:88 (-) Transcript_48272:3742-4005(-)
MEFPIEFRLVEAPSEEGKDSCSGSETQFFVFTKDLSSVSDAENLASAAFDVSLDPMFQTDDKGIILMLTGQLQKCSDGPTKSLWAVT